MASYAKNVSIWWRHHETSIHKHINVCLAIHPRNRLLFLFPSQCHQQLYGFPEHSLYSMQNWGISVTLYMGPYSLASQECIDRSSTKVYVDACPVAGWSHPLPDWFLGDHHCCQVNHLLAVAYHGPPWTLQNMGVVTTLSNGNIFHVNGWPFVRGIHRWRRSKKTSKLRVTGLCARWIPRTNGQLAENVSIWWRH